MNENLTSEACWQNFEKNCYRVSLDSRASKSLDSNCDERHAYPKVNVIHKFEKGIPIENCASITQQPKYSLECGFHCAYNLYKAIETFIQTRKTFQFKFNQNEFRDFQELVINCHNEARQRAQHIRDMKMRKKQMKLLLIF